MTGFGNDFIWGAATSAYQIEGATAADGRGESIWDRFGRVPGNILGAARGDVACDHYHRWREDIALMQEIGINGYRFSIAWPRVVPLGTGAINNAGLDFYDRLVDALLEAGIQPFPTLYHWDLPQPLEDNEGWVARRTAYAFADYAAVVAERLGDRIGRWVTINEPWVIAHHGHVTGEHAPGRESLEEGWAAAHHCLLAHGLATQALRASAAEAEVGIVLNMDAKIPRSQHPADRRAAYAAAGFDHRWYADPIFNGYYPEEMLASVHWDQHSIFDGDLGIINTPIDFLGLNYYRRTVVEDEGIDDVERPAPLIDSDLPRTTMGWEVDPDGLRDLLLWIHETYDAPSIYVTENGAAFDDQLEAGAVHDVERTSYLERHVAAVAQAMDRGVDVKGYFVWSLLDNFEWAFGYEQRFGIVHVDFASQARTIKDSGLWYRDTIAGLRAK
jgi:beta-glucosidase